MEELQRRSCRLVPRNDPAVHPETTKRSTRGVTPCYRLLWEDLSCEGFDGIESRKLRTDELLIAQDSSDGRQKLT